ncbi:DUF5642 family protein [Mycobacterium paraterrae]|uniref:DUF5642 family protein n=1 Tax=Mycobacterium paraterrae TaxID=577492 RepID=A0ABY3VN25_9MYCO|nr:DUF5642 family protein [Mycobacterium paraterrae]UMB68873.1 DUF5642 family protein [Mycobacterium paraterrae]
MLSVAGASRIGAAFLIVVTACGGLAGCASKDKSATQSPSSTTTSEAPGGFDISRIDQVGLALPPEMEAVPIPHTTVNEEEAKKLAGMRKDFSYDPPQCGALLSKSSHLVAGSQIQGVSVRKPQEIVILAVESPAAVADPPDVAGCNRVSFSVPGEVKGTAERIPGPPIAGLKTTGTKTHADLTTPQGPKTVDETTFRAELSGRVEIAVGGRGDPAPLVDLLNKAVVAVRGH